ncbi:MAG: hypothetical protein ACK5M1_11950 [Xanthomarina gelatinilytica]|uniref:hypothetical protein n=1 Tax=Xanthomarina gelatinilytica TaxID=1137281 RepID=UPI003A89EAE8
MTQEERYLWYKNKKRFGFTVLPIFKENEFDKAIQILNLQKADFVFILNKLNANERLEFKNDYSDQLEKLKNLQQFSKYKELIEKQIQEVNSRYENFKPKSNELQQYYNCIIRVDYFKMHLDKNDDLYYSRAIEDWKNYRNTKLLKHDVLSKRKSWLIPFNNRLANLMTKIVFNFKSVIEWKEQHTGLHPNTLEVVLSRHLEPLRGMITGFRLNYDNNKLLAYEMQKYCLNGFKQMITFIESDLLIRIENAPYFNLIQEVINIEDVKLSILSRELSNNKDQEPQPDTDDKEFKFENNFDQVEPNRIYAYFNVSLVEKGYLSKEDLESYLILAFQDKIPPKEKFTFTNLHIEKIRTIFYTYYKDFATNTHTKKKLYASLLGDFFNSFTTQKVMNNFADGYKKVRN